VTAELVVMNRSAAALAADSAVTIDAGSGTKIYGSVNKIFALSKYQPVGVMIYGNGELLGVPWEVAVKRYREHLFERHFDTLGEYAYDFISYMGACHDLFPTSVQKDYYEGAIRPYFSIIRDEIQSSVEEDLESGPISDATVAAITSRTILNHWKQWKEAESLPFKTPDYEEHLRKSYESSVNRIWRRVFEELPLGDKDVERVEDLSIWLVSKTPPDSVNIESSTGVVVVGYGVKEFFPSLIEIEVHTIANDELVCWIKSSPSIDRETTAVVSAFAQKEMVSRFMAGIDPIYQGTIEESLEAVLRGYSDEIVKRVSNGKLSAATKRGLNQVRTELMASYSEALAKHRKSTYIDGVTRAVANLPLEELAEMAESLVKLTKLKRRVSMETESVGGPIDVAVITRGDGFVWIKRKHYFEPDRNPQFFANYNRRPYG
jgi:hypothetical protein